MGNVNQKSGEISSVYLAIIFLGVALFIYFKKLQEEEELHRAHRGMQPYIISCKPGVSPLTPTPLHGQPLIFLPKSGQPAPTSTSTSQHHFQTTLRNATVTVQTSSSSSLQHPPETIRNSTSTPTSRTQTSKIEHRHVASVSLNKPQAPPGTSINHSRYEQHLEGPVSNNVQRSRNWVNYRSNRFEKRVFTSSPAKTSFQNKPRTRDDRSSFQQKRPYQQPRTVPSNVTPRADIRSNLESSFTIPLSSTVDQVRTSVQVTSLDQSPVRGRCQGVVANSTNCACGKFAEVQVKVSCSYQPSLSPNVLKVGRNNNNGGIQRKMTVPTFFH